jgi:hypothetical protein
LRLPEQKFWDLLKRNNVLPGDISRVENTVDTGTPDISGAYYKDYWVELKAVEKEYSQGLKIETLLEPSQIVWHSRRVMFGSIIFIMTKYNDAIFVSVCIAPKLYENVEVFFKEKNTFDYIKLQSTLIYLIKETPWCM